MIQRVHSSNMISLYIYTACSYQNEIKYNKAIPRFAHLLSLRCFGRLFLRAIHLWLVRHRNKVLLISYIWIISTLAICGLFQNQSTQIHTFIFLHGLLVVPEVHVFPHCASLPLQELPVQSVTFLFVEVFNLRIHCDLQSQFIRRLSDSSVQSANSVYIKLNN
jgi:hypothetical protein